MTLLLNLPNGLRYWRVGSADSLDRQKKLEVRKMLEKPHRTHPSSARFVRRIVDFTTSL
jgi:hypothetical protein